MWWCKHKYWWNNEATISLIKNACRCISVQRFKQSTDVIRCRTVYLVFAFKKYNTEIMEVSFQFARNDNDHIEFKQVSRLPPVCWAKMADLVDSSFALEYLVWQSTERSSTGWLCSKMHCKEISIEWCFFPGSLTNFFKRPWITYWHVRLKQTIEIQLCGVWRYRPSGGAKLQAI